MVAGALFQTVDLTVELIQNHHFVGLGKLLEIGAAVWLANNIAFALLYWEMDSGGAAARAHGLRAHPDFAFPQHMNPELAPDDWRPRFVDYLYVGFTNATAMSPTERDAADGQGEARHARAVDGLAGAVRAGHRPSGEPVHLSRKEGGDAARGRAAGMRPTKNIEMAASRASTVSAAGARRAARPVGVERRAVTCVTPASTRSQTASDMNGIPPRAPPAPTARPRRYRLFFSS